MYGERRVSYAVLVSRTDRKEQLGKPGNRVEVTIKFDRQEVAWGVKNCADLSEDRDKWQAVFIVVMDLHVSLNAGGVFEYLRKCELLEQNYVFGVSNIIYRWMDGWII